MPDNKVAHSSVCGGVSWGIQKENGVLTWHLARCVGWDLDSRSKLEMTRTSVLGLGLELTLRHYAQVSAV